MKGCIVIISLFLSWFFIPTGTHLFSQDLKFGHIGIQDGLSAQTINCIYQDHIGFLWIGTQDGLNRYDGNNFKIYRSDPNDSTSISHSWVWDIFEDTDNNLWVATWYGLNRMNRHTGEFTRFLPDSSHSMSISGDRPTSIVQDEEGYLWVGTWGMGLNRLDPRTHVFRRFPEDTLSDQEFPGPFVRELCYENGKLWIGTWNGLWKMTGSAADVYHFERCGMETEPLHTGRIISVHVDQEGLTWCGTLGEGIVCLDQQDNVSKKYRNYEDDPFSLSGDDVSMIRTDSNGIIWVATISKGLNRFNQSEGRFERIRHDPEKPGSIAGNNINCVFVDRSGMLWVGTEGLNRYAPELDRFEHYGTEPVEAVLEDSKGFIWIGTEGQGLKKYDLLNREFTSFQHMAGNKSGLSSNNISSLAEDNMGNIWIGTRGGGLNRYDPNLNMFTHFREDPMEQRTYGLDYINGISFDDSGWLWISTFNRGLIMYYLDSVRVRRLRSLPGNPRSLSGDYLFRSYKDSKGFLWICTWGAGLSMYDNSIGKFKRFPGNMVHTVHESINNGSRKIYAGTENGILVFNPDTIFPPDISHIGTLEGLPGNVINGILEDSRGFLWISTNNGLCRYHPQKKTVRVFTEGDGLQSNEFTAGSYTRTRNGKFVFGGINGFNVFHPDSVRDRQFQPPVVITSFSVSGQAFDTGEPVYETKTIRLSHSQNFFSFEFSALDYSGSGSRNYMYRLEGIDNDWVDAGNRNYASYTKIDPGIYEFQVRGTNSDGIFSPHTARVSLIINPPYWQTWWFRTLGLILLAVVLYNLHLARLRKVREIERLRVRIASDLHDDIGSTLTRITMHSQQVRTSNDSSRIKENADKIGELSRNVISTMSDIVWSIDSRNDSLGDLLARMQDFAHNSLSTKDIAVEFLHAGLDREKKIQPQMRQNLYYIFKEAINNALKYSEAKRVQIVLQNGSGFILQVKDDGKGFDPARSYHGNGLKNMRMRAEQISAKLEIEGFDGSTVRLEMNSL